MKTRLSVLLIACLLIAVPVFADDLQQDLKARRARLMEKVPAESMLVFFSAPSRVYSSDVSYEYRQDSDLYYLTGITQPDAILVLMPGNRTHKELLFVRPADARREHGLGHTLTTDEATSRSGIDKVLMSGSVEGFLIAMYIREQALNDLPKAPANIAFVEKVRGTVSKYANIGIRIEDSFLLTATGLERLSAAVPRTVQEIEAFRRTGRSRRNKR